MPISSSHGNFSAKGHGTSVGRTRIRLRTDPAPASTRREYTSSGVDYVSLEITSSSTFYADGPGGFTQTLDILVQGGGFNGTVSGDIANGGAGGPGGQYNLTTLSITGGNSWPIVVGGAGAVSTFGPLPSAVSNGGTGGAAGSTSVAGGAGGAGIGVSYATGSTAYYAAGGGGGGSPAGAGGSGVGGPGNGGSASPFGNGGGGSFAAQLFGPLKGGTVVPSPAGAGSPGVVIIRGPRELFI